jgi:molybdenum cofactor synthesis domain-containing protein
MTESQSDQHEPKHESQHRAGPDGPAGEASAFKRVKVLTVSDGVVAGTRDDTAGRALEDVLVDRGWSVVERRQVSDGVESVSDALVAMSYGFNGLIVTTGGTGFGPRDLTPEGTLAVLDRQAPGMAEAMRLCNDSGLGRLSRAVAGTRKECLVINTPGSTKGAVETLSAVLDVIPHAIELLAGHRPH